MGKTIDLHNFEHKYFKVTGKTSIRDKWGNVYWTCLCNCGNSFTAIAFKIQKQTQLSCGCIKRHGSELEKGKSEFNRLYRAYKRQASIRKIHFDLTKAELAVLSKMTCFYCGADPSNTMRSRYSTGDYTYNGIDRIDNNEGYIKSNVVPCCNMCNKMKSNFTYTQFITQCKAISSKIKDI